MPEFVVLLDQRAGLIAVRARHHDVDENQIGTMVGDLGQGVEPVLREDHRTASLEQENLGTAAYRIAVVDYHNLDARQWNGFRQVTSCHKNRPDARGLRACRSIAYPVRDRGYIAMVA